MELLLNLAWLLLAVPAYYVWRGRGGARRSTSLQCLLALGCVLVVLFPVISATDDLLVMRNEIEESPASKRSARQSSGERSGPVNPSLHAPAALVSPPMSIQLEAGLLPAARRPVVLPIAAPVETSDRAPPTSPV